jgi:hypothetical protein
VWRNWGKFWQGIHADVSGIPAATEGGERHRRAGI